MIWVGEDKTPPKKKLNQPDKSPVIYGAAIKIKNAIIMKDKLFLGRGRGLKAVVYERGKVEDFFLDRSTRKCKRPESTSADRVTQSYTGRNSSNKVIRTVEFCFISQ
jgi:hypothetical protein